MMLQPNPRPLWQRYVAVLVYLLLSLVLVTIFATGLYLVDAAAFRNAEKLPFRALAYSVAGQIAGFALPAWLLIKFLRGRVFGFRAVQLRYIFLCFALSFFSMLVFGIIYHFLNIDISQLRFLDSNEVRNHKTGFVVLVSVIVPVYEELVFRGLMFGALVSGIKDKRKVLLGALFCALMFTVSHFEGKHSLSALPPILVMAVIFQYMTWRTQSLWPATIAHAMQNLISSAAFFVKFTAQTAK